MLELSMIQILAGLEIFVVLLVLAIFMTVRSIRLSSRVKELLSRKPEVKTVETEAEAIDYEAYLRDEIIKTKGFLDAYDDEEGDPPDWLVARHHFLDLELEAQVLVPDPEGFQSKLRDGFEELMDRYRPEAVEAEPAEAAVAVAPTDNSEYEQEKLRLRDLIGHQQDAMKKLREELESREGEIAGLESIVTQLDSFEAQTTELMRCIEVLEQENDRLKHMSNGDDASEAGSSSEELNRLRDMIEKQQSTIGELQASLEGMTPEEGQTEDLDGMVSDVLKSNQELNTCILVLEEENQSLRDQLTQSNTGESADIMAEPAQDSGELETKIRELESLLEFKDATIAQLEKDIKDVMAANAGGEVIGGDDELKNKVQELESLLEFKDATVEQLEADIATLRAGDGDASGGDDELKTKVQELESLLEFKDATVEQLEKDLDESRAAGAGGASEELEIKVQELEALVEFKDAAVEELEKQHAQLERKLLELSGGEPAQ